LHIQPRLIGQASLFSRFLTGETILDPVSGKMLTFNELARRATLLADLIARGAAAVGAFQSAAVE
jgi:hypothetical protein